MLLRRIQDHHAILDVAFSALTINGHSPAVTRAITRRLTSDTRWMRILLVIASTMALPFQCYLSAMRKRYVLVREFWNLPLLVAAPLLFPIRRRIIFNINHNLFGQTTRLSKVLKLLVRSGFRFLLLDGALSQFIIRTTDGGGIYSCRFPAGADQFLSCGERDLNRQSQVTVSLVGNMRPEKIGDFSVADAVVEIAKIPRVKILLGRRAGEQEVPTLPDIVQIYDTTDAASYLRLLRMSDYVVILASRSAYFSRNSGTIMDAISAGAIPVVPNFPVFRSQVSDPVPVGIVYDRMGDIAVSIERSLGDIETISFNRRAYTASRSKVSLEIA